MTEVQKLNRNWTNYRFLSYHFATLDDYIGQMNKEYFDKEWSVPYLSDPKHVLANSERRELDVISSYHKFYDFYTSHSFVKHHNSDLNRKSKALSSLFVINNLANLRFDKKIPRRISDLEKLKEIRKNVASLSGIGMINIAHSSEKDKNTFIEIYDETNDSIEEIFISKALDSLRKKKSKEGEDEKDKDIENHKILESILNGNISQDLHPIILFNPTLTSKKEIVNITTEASQIMIFDENLDHVDSQIDQYHIQDKGKYS